MLELDIQDFYDNAVLSDYSNSIARSGQSDIGKRTWNNALKRKPPLLSDSELPLARAYFGSLNAEWEELPDDEVQALAVQYVSGELQEYETCDGPEDYETQSNAGRVSGSIFTHNGRLHITLSE